MIFQKFCTFFTIRFALHSVKSLKAKVLSHCGGVSLLLCMLFFATNVEAHALHAVAQYDGKYITGSAFYSDQTPARETYVSAKLINGNEFIESKTDNVGNFSIQAPDLGNYLVTVEGEEGHKVSLKAQRIQTDNQTNSRATQSEFALLRQDIAALHHKLFLHDILSGIGYILGIVGLFTFYRAQKGRK